MFYYKNNGEYINLFNFEDDSLLEKGFIATNDEAIINEIVNKTEKNLERLEKISKLKAELESTDYKAVKFAEGWITTEEYEPIKREREALREQIRALEN